jgi:hypothetical protein
MTKFKTHKWKGTEFANNLGLLNKTRDREFQRVSGNTRLLLVFFVSALQKAAVGGLKKGRIVACRETMTDDAVSIIFCALHMLVVEARFSWLSY